MPQLLELARKAQRPIAQRYLPAVGIGALPLSILLNVKDTLALDGLHITLIEILLLFIIRLLFTFSRPVTPALVQSASERPQGNGTGSSGHSSVQKEKVVIREPVFLPTSGTDQRPLDPTLPFATSPHHSGGTAQDTEAAHEKDLHGQQQDELEEHPLYSNEELDHTLAELIALVDPPSLDLLPDQKQKVTASLPLSDWKCLYQDETVQVALHPSITALYAITCHFVDVPLRSLWELLTSIDIRASWDSMCESTMLLDRIDTSREATVDYMALKGMFPVSPKDLVMLCVHAQLPSTTTLDGRPIRRLVCASNSVEHPSKPPQTGSYSRMIIRHSGFIIKDDGRGGCVLTQMNDLSSLGSWIPSKIINLVTNKLIPRSMKRMGRAALATPWGEERKKLQGDAWLPPALGSWNTTGTRENAKRRSTTGLVQSQPESEQMKEDHERQVGQTMPASEARSLSAIEAQLRTLTARLAQLEREGDIDNVNQEHQVMPKIATPASTWWSSLAFWRWSSENNVSRGSKRGSSNNNTDLALIIKSSVGGGLVTAAAFVAFALVWSKRTGTSR